MVRLALLGAYSVLLASQASAGCNYFSDRSVVFADNTLPVCEETFDGVLSNSALNWDNSAILLDSSEGDYWQEWAFQSHDTKILTQSLKKNYFGLGVWMPEELLAEESKMTAEEWLLSHGVMFSVGFGDKRDGEPRMRLDYRWHEYYNADWMMQIELPF